MMQGDTCKNYRVLNYGAMSFGAVKLLFAFGDGMKKSGETFLLAHVERSKRQNSPPFPGKGL